MTIKATITGRLTADPELTFGQSGKARASLSIAVNHGRKDQQGQWQETGTTFVRAALWEHHAESAAEHLRKGQLVIAEGRLETRAFETKDGGTGQSLELQVDAIGPALRRYPPRDAHPQSSGFAPPVAADPWAGQPSGGGWDAPKSEPPF